MTILFVLLGVFIATKLVKIPAIKNSISPTGFTTHRCEKIHVWEYTPEGRLRCSVCGLFPGEDTGDK